jgi:hypothetical protein
MQKRQNNVPPTNDVSPHEDRWSSIDDETRGSKAKESADQRRSLF